jgi:hypothetical protein
VHGISRSYTRILLLHEFFEKSGDFSEVISLADDFNPHLEVLELL